MREEPPRDLELLVHTDPPLWIQRPWASSFMGWEATGRFETVGAVVRWAVQLCEGCLLWARVGARNASEVAICAKRVREKDLHQGHEWRGRRGRVAMGSSYHLLPDVEGGDGWRFCQWKYPVTQKEQV